MYPLKIFQKWLEDHATQDHYLFSTQDLRPLFPHMSEGTFKTLLSRAVSGGVLDRICRGLYRAPKAAPSDGLLLFRAAAALRSNAFTYLSLETVLSEAGVISQVPINWISLMSSGRSNTISCGKFGTIEFVHTRQKPASLQGSLVYDPHRGLWRASVVQALRDMKATHRTCDLIDKEAVCDFI